MKRRQERCEYLGRGLKVGPLFSAERGGLLLVEHLSAEWKAPSQQPPSSPCTLNQGQQNHQLTRSIATFTMAGQAGQAGLRELPVELLLAICSALCRGRADMGHVDMSRLSRTCRHLRDTLQPLVFSSCSRHDNTRAQHVQFLRALTLRPELAQCVKHLRLGWSIANGDPIPPSDLRIIDSVAAKFHLPSDTSQEFTVDCFNYLPAIELILLHTPNLMHLNLPLNPEWGLVFLPDHVSSNPSSVLLPRLTTLHIDHYYSSGDNFELPLNVVMTLCAAAPNLQYLHTCNPSGSPDEANWDYPGLLSNLRRLEFDGVCLTQPDVLREIFKRATRLETVGITWHPTAASYNWCENRTAADVWEMLRTRKGTLREVRLDICRVYDQEGEWSLGRVEWSSLGDFEKLEVLKVGEYALEVLKQAWQTKTDEVGMGGFFEDLVPRGIKEVTLWQPGADLIPAVRRLGDAVTRGLFSALEKVVVAPTGRVDWIDESDWRNARVELQGVFERRRVKFEVETKAAYPPTGPFFVLNPYQF